MAFRPLRFLRNFRRSREIVTVLLTHGFADLVDRIGLRRYVQWGRRLIFWRKQPERRFTRAQRIRMALESLGPTFIKFGQVMSTRPDLVPRDVLIELEKLQEQVPPFSGDDAVEAVEESLSGRIDILFAEFDRTPVAAGSLGQVHRAILDDGTPVAVKVRRPNVIARVERDLSLMMELAVLVENYVPEAAVFDPVGLVTHFSRTIRRELCFTREARMTDEFARLFRNDATLVVPQIFWDYTTEAVLTMEFLEGRRVAGGADFTELPVTGKQVAANGARIFMKMAFEFGLFHGDPHPGNLRIMPDGSIGLLDFGMVGLLDDDQREQLVDLLLAISHRNAAAAVDVILTIGQTSSPIDTPLLRSDVREFVNNYYDVSLGQLNVGNMLSDFVSILASHGVRCPADLMLLIRALIALEGVGRELDADFNLAEHLAPFIEQIVRERYNPRRMAQRLIAETKRFATLLHDMPLNLGRVVEKLGNDELKLQLDHQGMNHLITELDRSSNRIVISMVMASLILASALILRSGNGSLWFTIPVYVLSSLLGLWLIYGIFRSGRL